MRNWLEYLPFIVVARLVRALPRRTALALGRRLGACCRFLTPGRARTAREGLRHAYPEMAPAEREIILKGMFAHLGAGFVEMLRIDLAGDAEALRQDLEVSGADHVRAALAEGRGAILLTGHLGFWEAGNFTFSMLGYQIGIVAKPMRNPLVDQYFLRMRENAGGYVINSRKGARRILKALQQNHLVGILMDQHAGRRQGVQVPFFGRPAWTTPIIAELAMKYRVPIVPAFAWRIPGDRYHVEIDAPILLDETLSPETIAANTARLTAIIEAAVRRDPSQWFWVHRRWR